MDSYWNVRYHEEGLIWGQNPSSTAFHARDIFKQNNVTTVLVPGSGYGRNTKALSADFTVEGIELSGHAVKLARQWDPQSHFMEGSVLDSPTGGKKYDAVYCFDLLHLFLLKDRRKLIDHCIKQLNDSGIMYFTCFSDEDTHNGAGKRVEEGTFEYMEGKCAHFFTEEDLINHFGGLNLMEVGSVTEKLTYQDERTKEYLLRYIVVKKD
ncbi:class I SAM-dependent methyltransferase [Paenibacillus sp. M1]|uniref:Class I SAM-dependent methyltransferase n=1 Tax=Paenibacillus haidiansis TaxID=1574488 RepID=A0ABU7VSF4_9BACL